jgi:hypothetical protein
MQILMMRMWRTMRIQTVAMAKIRTMMLTNIQICWTMIKMLRNMDLDSYDLGNGVFCSKGDNSEENTAVKQGDG